MCDVSHSNFFRVCGNEIHAGPRLGAHLQYSLLQRTNAKRQHATALHLLQHTTATTLLQHTYFNTLLHHTTALHECNHTLPQQTTTSYYLGSIPSRIFAIPSTGTRHCNKLTATVLLQQTYCNTLLRHAYCTTRIQRHATATLCCVISLVPLPPRACLQHSQLQYTAATNLLQHIYCNTLLHHTPAPHYCTTLLHHAYCTTRMQRHYCNTLLQHITRTLSPCAYLQH